MGTLCLAISLYDVSTSWGEASGASAPGPCTVGIYATLLTSLQIAFCPVSLTASHRFNMAAAAVETAGVNIPAPDLNGPQVAESVNYLQRYNDERDKRLKSPGAGQFVNLRAFEKYKRFLEDPWIATGTPVQQVVAEGGHVKVLIVGAGYGALQNAVHLIKSGLRAEDLVIVDPAGGFGGTWYDHTFQLRGNLNARSILTRNCRYWNRYPGLMCDVESYIYMPFLEEFPDYIPSWKYVGGEELRQHADRIATKNGLHERAMFQTTAKSAIWNEQARQWNVKVEQQPKGGSVKQVAYSADFVIINAGVLSISHLPDLAGVDDFAGHSFHTSRWDWSYTGGTIDDPTLTGLQGERVGIIGTGASAIQVIPQVAKYAKELYVFQRTPSAVDVRNNQKTDVNKWNAEVATGPGWQRQRSDNFDVHMQEDLADSLPNLVNDGWTGAKSFRALTGFPNQVTMETVGDHVAAMHAEDYPRQERIRQRVADVVKDPKTAEKLKAWYPTWCKRACFHDEYLPTFNRPNVHLVDTDGKGVDSITPSGVMYAGQEHPVDVLVWATGFQSPFLGSPAEKCDMTVIGREGLSMAEKNKTGLTTLHGVFSRSFPNMFWCGPLQTAVTPNFSYSLGIMAEHIAYIISAAATRSKDKGVAVEPTAMAEGAYAQRIASMALVSAPVAGCTPGYTNLEGELDKLETIEQKMAITRMSSWGQGIKSYQKFLSDWQEDGTMNGIEVRNW